MFKSSDVADYYNTTQNHYERWWNLKDQLSLHYGIWDSNTKNFTEALVNTNATLLKEAEIQSTDLVLDAGCGVGGAALFVHDKTGASVTGLTLSQKQLQTARNAAQQKGIQDQVQFEIMDFTQTTFPDESFDVIWACESVCHVPDKRDFIQESFRLLKKGGRLVLFDFFQAKENQSDPNNWMHKWAQTWAVDRFASIETFSSQLKSADFSHVETHDYTQQIERSAKKLYYASLLAAIPSETYNLLHPNVSRFAKTHYRCGYYQYKALQKDLWKYFLVKAVK